VLQTVHTNAQVTRISTVPSNRRPDSRGLASLQIDVTPDGSTALVTSFDNAVISFDLKTNKVTYTLHDRPFRQPNGICHHARRIARLRYSFTNVTR